MAKQRKFGLRFIQINTLASCLLQHYGGNIIQLYCGHSECSLVICDSELSLGLHYEPQLLAL